MVDLLREEENKYCADCEAKQPRWASWNLGVFLCIRCAGIHRNLGVHLTKVYTLITTLSNFFFAELREYACFVSSIFISLLYDKM